MEELKAEDRGSTRVEESTTDTGESTHVEGLSFHSGCLDATFAEWSALASSKLVVQLGMHCTGDGSCADPRDRILGRRSSFSLTAATYGGARTVALATAADLDPATFSPPGARPEKGLAHACSARPVLEALAPGRAR